MKVFKGLNFSFCGHKYPFGVMVTSSLGCKTKGLRVSSHVRDDFLLKVFYETNLILEFNIRTDICLIEYC